MSQNKAMIREFVERIDGVVGTHFELEIKGHSRKKTLVVEVDFDLDSNGPSFSRTAIDSIESTFETMLREDNSDVVSKLKIVSRADRSSNKTAGADRSQSANSPKSGSTDVRSTPN